MPAFEAVLLPSSLSLPLPLPSFSIFYFAYTRACACVYKFLWPGEHASFLTSPFQLPFHRVQPTTLPSLLFSPPFISFILFFFPFPPVSLSLSLSFFFIHRLASMASLHRAPEQIGISAGGDVLVKRNKLSPS